MARGAPDLYRLIEVEAAWPTQKEAMGTKRKFWCRPTEDGVLWLFKYPRPGSGEHWAEKIAAEVAGCLGISHAVVELATAEGTRGSISKSFARGGRVLFHGNELLAKIMEYDIHKFHGVGSLSRQCLPCPRGRVSKQAGSGNRQATIRRLSRSGRTDRKHGSPSSELGALNQADAKRSAQVPRTDFRSRILPRPRDKRRSEGAATARTGRRPIREKSAGPRLLGRFRSIRPEPAQLGAPSDKGTPPPVSAGARPSP